MTFIEEQMNELKKPMDFKIKEQTVIIDEEDYPVISRFTWHVKKDKNTFYAYTQVKFGGKPCGLPMHRLVTGMSNSQIDHINRNGIDNRKENLRYCTNQQNSYNRVHFNKHGFRGVYIPRGCKKFAYQIAAGKKRRYKYGYETAAEAARGYDEASKELHGEFGIRNFKD